MVHFTLSCSLLCAAAGCSSGDNVLLYKQFQDDNPSVRISAVVRAGELKDPGAVGYLVDRLDDSEPDVRLAASIALEKITGQTLGYRVYDRPQERHEAVQRWRVWLRERASRPAATQPGQSPATAPAATRSAAENRNT
jgi:HEAT repeat protein